MRSYTKAWITSDFKTVFVNPPSPKPDGMFKVAIMRSESNVNQVTNYNYLANPANWIGYDVDNNPIVFVSGLELAVRNFRWIVYADHPKN
jgi:hypothetical protein